jgi:hypothetical protein
MVFLNNHKNQHFSIETVNTSDFRGKHWQNLSGIHVKVDLDYKDGRTILWKNSVVKPCLQICLFLDVSKFIVRLTLFVLFCCIFC